LQAKWGIAEQKYPIIAIEIQNILHFLNESISQSHLPMHFCAALFGLSKALIRQAFPTSGNSEKHIALQRLDKFSDSTLDFSRSSNVLAINCILTPVFFADVVKSSIVASIFSGAAIFCDSEARRLHFEKTVACLLFL
jgi:hypothetical protein